jgi:hypothetical protein
MPRDIVITPAFTVPAKTLHMEDCEEICQTCKGTGKITMVYRELEPNLEGPCYDCNGEGKRFKCKSCGGVEHYGMIKHKERPDLDGLCYFCLKSKLRKEVEQKIKEINDR